jgi:hypothetical protein
LKADSEAVIKSSEESVLETENFEFTIKPNTFVIGSGNVYN